MTLNSLTRHTLFFFFFMLSLETNLVFAKRNGMKADAIYARNLLNSFKSFCPTSGNWSDNALEASRKLQNVLNSIIEDPACADIASSISRKAGIISQSLERFRGVPIEREILAYRRQQKNLLILMRNPNTSQEDIKRYQNLMRENQLELLIKESYLPYDEDKVQREYLTNVVVNSAYETFRQASLNQQCLFRSPMFLSAISSLGTSVAAGLVSEGESLGLAALSTVLGHTLEFIRTSKLRKKVRRLGQVEYISAYQCVLESLSNQWCHAKESLDLIKLKMESTSTGTKVLKVGSDLLNRDLPLLKSWLERLSAGTPPENIAIATRQNIFRDRQNELDKWAALSIGRLNEERDNLPKILNTDEERENQFRALHQAISQMVEIRVRGNETFIHPVFAVASRLELPWMLAGIPITEVPTTRSSTGEGVSVISFERSTPLSWQGEYEDQLGHYYPLDPNRIFEGISFIFHNANILLTNQQSRVLNADPDFLFFEAETNFRNDLSKLKLTSPVEAIRKILRFFNKYLYIGGDGRLYVSVEGFGRGELCPSAEALKRLESNPFQQSTNTGELHTQTLGILCAIKDQIQNRTGGNSVQRIQTIFEVAGLQHGTVLITERINKTVEFILSEVLLHIVSTGTPLQLELLVADNFVRELTQYNSDNLSEMKADIVGSLKITEATLQNFTEIFSDGIGSTLEIVSEMKHNDEYSFTSPLDRYCSLLLGVPNWKSGRLKNKIDLSLCEGRALKSEWKEGQVFNFPLTRETYHSEFRSDRICHYRRFMMREYLYQIYPEDVWRDLDENETWYQRRNEIKREMERQGISFDN